MELILTLGLKEIGGISLLKYSRPAAIIRGGHCKLALIINDVNNRALTITDKTIKLNLKKSDGTILTLSATPIDNNKGECEFELTSESTSLLKIDPGQSVEVEIVKTATPTIKSFYEIKSAITVTDKALVSV